MSIENGAFYPPQSKKYIGLSRREIAYSLNTKRALINRRIAQS
jgi:hypothetical protein